MCSQRHAKSVCRGRVDDLGGITVPRMDISGVLSIVSLIIGFLILLPLIVGGVFVVVVVANRADPDPSGRRPALVYAMGTSFLTLFVTLLALTAMVAALCELIGTHGHEFGGGGHQHPIGDSVARAAVLAGVVALIAGVICALHLRASARASADATAPNPLARVRSSYAAAVAFVSVLLVVIASVVAIYDIFRIAAP